jgi:hypothetical protein
MMKFLALSILLFLTGCVYTFSGSTLPANIKTVEVPLFENTALVQGIAERITEVLAQKVAREKLTLVARNGDAIIRGTVVSYKNTATDYTGTRDNLTIKSYSVEIIADIIFFDNKNDREIYRGRVVSIGYYDFASESEDDARERAVEEITDKILLNSIKSW